MFIVLRVIEVEISDEVGFNNMTRAEPFKHGTIYRRRDATHVCMYVYMGFMAVYNCSGLVHQVSGFNTVSVSAYGTYRILDCCI